MEKSKGCEGVEEERGGGVNGGREWEEKGGEGRGGGSCRVTQTPFGSLIKFSTFQHSH